jgi:hypothetical protein
MKKLLAALVLFAALCAFLAPTLVHAAPLDAGPVVTTGIGTSPSVPTVADPNIGDAWAAFGAGHYALGVASLLLVALVLVRKVEPRLFASDLAGAATALLSSFLAGLITALSTGAPLGWGMTKASFTIAVLAMGGYSVCWRKLLKPALRWVADEIGWEALAKALA